VLPANSRRRLNRNGCRVAAIVICAIAAVTSSGCSPPAIPVAAVELPSLESPAKDVAPETAARVAAFCGDCHALPRPESFPRDRWHFEVKKGYEFYAKSGRTDLDPPPIHETLAYYRSRAPESVSLPTSPEAPGPAPVRFVQEPLHLNTGNGILPEIANLRWTKLIEGEPPVLIACDMRYGHIVAIDLRPEGRQPPQLLGRLRNPCRVEPCDLDGNGTIDLAVADLGSFLPAEHERGRVMLLRREVGSNDYETVELLAGLGRVSDVRAGKLDGDGQEDLVVAEFGWQHSGGIHLLTNTTEPGGQLQFARRTLDDRPGTIHVPIHDLDRDGRPDIIALVSQQYESVDLLRNLTSGKFVRRHLWSAEDLTSGSSGLKIVDFDRDGDDDILVTSGDSFDNNYVSPWHGVIWLENQGDLQFVPHRLTDMTGAYRAVAGDFDGDSDNEVLAVAWLPRRAQPASVRETRVASIVLLEQTARGEFARHTLEWDRPYYATVEVGDFDADGDLDFAVGSGPNVAEGRGSDPYLAVWWNQTNQK
jgi:hypothetical protein